MLDSKRDRCIYKEADRNIAFLQPLFSRYKIYIIFSWLTFQEFFPLVSAQYYKYNDNPWFYVKKVDNMNNRLKEIYCTNGEINIKDADG